MLYGITKRWRAIVRQSTNNLQQKCQALPKAVAMGSAPNFLRTALDHDYLRLNSGGVYLRNAEV